MKKILLAVDGSDSSKNAAEKTADLVVSLDSEITIITVLPDPISNVGSASYLVTPSSMEQAELAIEQKKEELEAKGQEILNEFDDFFSKKVQNIEKIIRFGDPAHIICDYADENNFSLIVLADKGLGGIKRFLLGSVSDKVVRHARTSVLIVK